MVVWGALCAAALAAEPNPPVWPESVAVFSPDDPAMQGKINAAYAANGGAKPANHGQFSDKRYAFLFKPGRYETVDVPVGFYTQVMGLGATPAQTVFASEQGVYSQEQDFTVGGALSTFWRAAENFRTEATKKWFVGTGMTWAVSQAAPLRRVEVAHDLCLFQYVPPIPAAGQASGGFCAGVSVAGNLSLGSQQQWFARDSTVGKWNGGVWNVVTTGVKNAPPTHCSNTDGLPATTLSTTPAMADKPYITIDAAGQYSLQIPHLREDSSGYNADTSAVSVGFEQVYVTKVTDTAAAINAKLAAGLHVVVSPGIYHLDAPLRVAHTGQVLLGLGFATLVSAKQNAVVVVGDVDDVRVAGLLLQAGPAAGGSVAPNLLQVGETAGQPGNAAKPVVLSDVFARVGGPDGTPGTPVAVKTMYHVKRGSVIIDNAWLWRADHTAAGPPTPASNAVDHGLIVDGNGVRAYGLAVEHTNQDLVQWNGNDGATYFFQSELPYDATQTSFGDPGYAGYRVGANVTSHQGYGLGVYSYFAGEPVTVPAGIVAPTALEGSFQNCLSVHLSGGGGIAHILNGRGRPTNSSTQVQYLCP